MKFHKKSKKITIRFSKQLRTEMQHAIINSSYGLNGKSRWLADSIDFFTRQSNYIDLVEHGIDINQADLCTVEAFYLAEETLIIMKNALIKVRVRYPLFEGVQSAFIRACVTYRLMLVS